VGKLTSGCLSPSLGYGIGMGYLPPELAKPGTALELEVRGKRFPVQTVRKPFYRKEPKG
jgi:aminomethyltransferase